MVGILGAVSPLGPPHLSHERLGIFLKVEDDPKDMSKQRIFYKPVLIKQQLKTGFSYSENWFCKNMLQILVVIQTTTGMIINKIHVRERIGAQDMVV